MAQNVNKNQQEKKMVFLSFFSSYCQSRTFEIIQEDALLCLLVFFKSGLVKEKIMRRLHGRQQLVKLNQHTCDSQIFPSAVKPIF